jgi:prepilin-type N-terminal cleavage/methylation domain-containing protein
MKIQITGSLRMVKKIQGDTRGMTFLELIIAMAVVGSLATFAIPHFTAYRQTSCDQVAKSALRNAAMAQEAVYLDTNTYAGKIGDLTSRGYTALDGVTVTIMAYSNSQYTMTAVHTSGTKTWTLTGPGGNIQ